LGCRRPRSRSRLNLLVIVDDHLALLVLAGVPVADLDDDVRPVVLEVPMQSAQRAASGGSTGRSLGGSKGCST
jgi:hypothetical protein